MVLQTIIFGRSMTRRKLARSLHTSMNSGMGGAVSTISSVSRYPTSLLIFMTARCFWGISASVQGSLRYKWMEGLRPSPAEIASDKNFCAVSVSLLTHSHIVRCKRRTVHREIGHETGDGSGSYKS